MPTRSIRETQSTATSPSFIRRAAFLVMAGIAAVTTFSAKTANADVIMVNFSSNPLSVVPFNVDGVYLDLVAGTASTDYTSVPGFDINPFFTGTDGGQPIRFNLYTPDFTGGIVVAGVIPGISAQQLALGATIGPGLVYKNGAVNATSGSSDIHYIGFRSLNDSTSMENYGYLAIQQTSSPAVEGAVRILGWAYESSGAAITVSAVPEPASYAMLAAGLLGLGALRARRRLAE